MTPTTTPAPPPDPMKLLERAMGMDLEEAAKLALACAQRGLPGGRPGKHYSSPYEAAIDSALGDVEQSLVEQRAALSRAQSTTSTNLAKAIPGSNVPAQAVAEIAARVDKLEHRRLILAALMPLGRRAALLSRLADCEAESAELRGQIAEHRRHGEAAEYQPRIVGPYPVSTPRPPSRSSWPDAHAAMLDAARRVEANRWAAKHALDEWGRANPDLAAALRAHRKTA